MAGLQRCDTAGGEVAAPQANRIFAHAKRLAILELVQPASVKSTARAGRLAAITEIQEPNHLSPQPTPLPLP